MPIVCLGRVLTKDESQTVRHVPRVRTMRRALGITQKEFAARYHEILSNNGSMECDGVGLGH